MIVSPKKKKKKVGRPTNLEVKSSGCSLIICQQTKYLGVFVDENLTWNVHIKHVCNKLFHISGTVYKTWQLISQVCSYTFVLRSSAVIHSFAQFICLRRQQK